MKLNQSLSPRLVAGMLSSGAVALAAGSLVWMPALALAAAAITASVLVLYRGVMLDEMVALMAVVVGLIVVSRSLVLDPPLTISLVAALSAVPFKLAAPPGRRETAPLTLAALALVVVQFGYLLPEGIEVNAHPVVAAGVAVAAVAQLRVVRQPRPATSHLVRLLIGAIAIPVGAVVVSTTYVVPAHESDRPVGLAVTVVGLAVLVGGAAGASKTSRADMRRAVAFDSPDMAAEVDPSGRVIYWNDAWGEAVGDVSLDRRLGLDNWDIVRRAITESVRTRSSLRRDLVVQFAPARIEDLRVEVSPGTPELDSALVTMRIDASALDRQEAAVLREQVMLDSLTGLLNRRGLEQELEARVSDPSLWIVFADLDGFKQVNDQLGHHVGDEVLKEVATRLRKAWRSTDVVARIGGDEFVILTRRPIDERRILECADGVTFEYKGHHISASFGVSSALDGDTPQDVLRRADLDMYEVKRRRRAVRQSSASAPAPGWDTEAQPVGQ